MIESFLVTSRETLEASLVVGIVLAYLDRTNNHQYKKSVYYGIGFGIVSSIIAAFLFGLLANGFQGRTEQIFEGATMLIGAFLLTTMIFWMMQQRHIAKEIESKVHDYIVQPNTMFSNLGIFMLVSVAIIREGVETVIFLNAANYANGVNFIGGSLGILSAVLISYIFFVSARKINLKKIFNISSILLILFAAGLTAHGVHEFEEAGLVSGIITPLYDINPAINTDGNYPLLHEKGLIGSYMKGLFGYNGNPSLSEVIGYVGYLALIFVLYIRIEKSKFQAMQAHQNQIRES